MNMIDYFLAQIKVIRGIIKDKYTEDEEDDIAFEDLVILSIQCRFIEFCKTEEIDDGLEYTEDEKSYIQEIVKNCTSNNSILRKLYDDTYVVKNENGEPELRTKSGVTLNYFVKQLKERDSKKIFREQDLILRSATIYLCISIESLCYEVLKYYYLNIGKQTELDKKSISFKELQQLKSIDNAKDFMIEKELDEFFRDSFSNWFLKLDKILTISKDFKVDEIVKNMNELFLRRNLYVHTNGIINEIYLKNLESNLKKGDIIVTDIKYIEERITDVLTIAWIVYFKYCCLVNKGIDGELFTDINNILVENIKQNTNAIPQIFSYLEDCKGITESERLIAKMNRFLFYKLNNRFDEVKVELETFDVSAYAKEYVMAKAILLDRDDAFDLTKEYIDGFKNDEFLQMVSWPLFESLKGDNKFRELFMEKIRDYFDIKEEDEGEKI